jgi:heme-degrading monooxygenase HmoA
MIARTWKGITPRDKAAAYLDYLHKTGVKACSETPGNLGVFLLHRLVEDHAEFLFISLWESLEVIQRFAGPDVERAVYFPEDREFLQEMVPRVEHYEVAATPPRAVLGEKFFPSVVRGLL